jgi:hypothetical protein
MLLLGGVAAADPETDVSQLDLKNARQTVTVTGIEFEVLPSLGHGNGAAILAGPRFVRFVTESIFIGGGALAGPLLNRHGQTGGFGYGGFIAGREVRATDKLSFDVQGLIGGGGGTPAPEDNAAGFVIGLKLEFKAFSLSWPAA